MNPETQVRDILKRDGARLIRETNHYVYRLSNGRLFTLARTPSDKKRAFFNALSDLRRLLGLADPTRGQPGERREKPHRPPLRSHVRLHIESTPTPAPKTLREKLSSVQIHKSTPKQPPLNEFEAVMQELGVRRLQ